MGKISPERGTGTLPADALSSTARSVTTHRLLHAPHATPARSTCHRDTGPQGRKTLPWLI